MKTITTIRYEADDGTKFNILEDCERYELVYGLIGHIDNTLYISDHDGKASAEDISKYIHENVDVINSYVNKSHKVS